MNPYTIIIICSLLIIVSSFFSWISKKTNIPSVLLLIGLGMGLKIWATNLGIDAKNIGLSTLLELLGNVGLVFIVLEAALDLELKREKTKVLVRSFLVALVGFTGTLFGIAFLLNYVFPISSFYTCLIYATPLSIMSSAIIIPSIGGLVGHKKEFMVYESTFSDILGIMVFYFLMGTEGKTAAGPIALEITINVLLTAVLSVIFSFLLVFLIQRMTAQVKLFLIVAVLLLLFALGKTFHLSSLLLILIFGLLLNNVKLFFGGRLSSFYKPEVVRKILHEFHTLILESAFLIRTFFFIVFGFSIVLTSLYSLKVALIGISISVLFYVVRFFVLFALARKHLFPELWLAPRGLITILLFFSIQKNELFTIPGFEIGILIYPIFISSVVMTFGLILSKGTSLKDAIIQQLPHLPNDLNPLEEEKI